MVNLVQMTITDEMADKLNSAIKFYQKKLGAEIEHMRIDGNEYFIPAHLPSWDNQVALRDIRALLKLGRTIMVDLKTARLIDEITNA